MSLNHAVCTRCAKLMPVWVIPSDPYVCPVCKNKERANLKSYLNDPDRVMWGKRRAQLIADEMQVNLDIDATGSRVREIDGETYSSWQAMYARLYRRKLKARRKGGEHD